MLTWHYKIGYYEVGTEIVFNKVNALIKSNKNNLPIRWNFNDAVYSNIDWTVPIDTPLFELYRKRAQQLRDQYDYLMLYFSGGADSINMLHSFINNGIFVDEIVMQYPKPVESTWNDKDLSNNNYFSEIKYAAFRHLEKVRPLIDSRTKIKTLDQCGDTVNMFLDQYWFEKYPLSTMITPAGAGRQISAILDPDLDKLYEQGKTVCQLYGVDKPLLKFHNNGSCSAFFRDANATHAIPTGFTLGEIAEKYFHLEFFYWTPDMPEIVVKQAQLLKQAAMADQQIKINLNRDDMAVIRSTVHPIIYTDEALSLPFQVVKPSSNVFRPMDFWFWDEKYKKSQQNFLQVIKYLERNINLSFQVDSNIYNGIRAIDSKHYFL